MSATFQTIPTANPAESAFVLTVDDNLITPLTLPAVGTAYADWVLGQRERTKDTEWDDYVFVDTQNAAPGRRAFVFGKSHSEAEMLVPFETVWDTEFHRWPAVVAQQLKVLTISVSSNPDVTFNSKFLIKSAAEANCVVKIEHFQNALQWGQEAFRHRIPVTDDLNIPEESLAVNDCLHGEIILSYSGNSGTSAVYNPAGTSGGLGYTIPATNFTDWAPFVLRDTQKQSNGLWVREKVTVFPPINAKRKMV